MSDRGGSFLFGITVSEIAFILFFVLLLFSFVVVVELEEEKEAVLEERDNFEQSYTAAKIDLTSIKRAFGNLDDSSLGDPLTILTTAAEAINEAEEKDTKISDLQARNSELQAKSIQAGEKLTSMEQESSNLLGQVANLKKRAGVGDPPCWVADESGEIEYLFKIALRSDETVMVERAAPARRDADYFALPSVEALTARVLPLVEFERLSLPIYMVGRESTPQCRHFVRLSFSDRNACRLFLVVERFFYKVVERGESRVCVD